MTRKEKLIQRFYSVPSDFTWEELKRLLHKLGYYEQVEKGHSSGSRVKFINENKRIISLHRPHPSSVVKKYVIRQIITFLEQ